MTGQIYIVDRPPAPSSLQALDIDQTSGGIGITLPTGLTWDKVGSALITSDSDSGNCRYSTDGTAPTADLGHELLPSQGVAIGNARALIAFRAIAESSTHATLQVTLYRREE
jgi:hypothetical protein